MMPPPLVQWKFALPRSLADLADASSETGRADPAPRTAAAPRQRSPLLCLALCLLAAAALGGCGFVGFPGVYKIDVEQGNLVDQKMIEQLQAGMSKRQVRFIMGSPLVEDTFHPDRWDYPYVIRNGETIIREAQVIILFENDRLIEIRGDYLPEWARTETAEDAPVE